MIGKLRIALGAAADVARVDAVLRERAGALGMRLQQLVPIEVEITYERNGDAQLEQILDDGRVGQPGVGAAQLFRNGRMTRGESFDVHLVDQRAVPRGTRRHIVAPTERRINHHGPGHVGRAIALIEREIAVRVANGIAKEGVVPAQMTGDGHGVWVQQEFVGVEALTRFGSIGTVNAITIQLAWAHRWQVSVPDMVGVLGHADALSFARALWPIEQTEVYGARILRKQGKVNAGAIPGGA